MTRAGLGTRETYFYVNSQARIGFTDLKKCKGRDWNEKYESSVSFSTSEKI